MTHPATVCAVVVTRDRKALLEECLGALGAQTRSVDEILVVDNASSDGTEEMIGKQFPEVLLRRLPDNVGGAGGFAEGLQWGFERGHTWLWVMDDDTIPDPDALEMLLAGAERAPDPALLFSSLVLWVDGTQHPMNTPNPRWRRMGQLTLAATHRLVLLRNATFVSVMFHRDAIARFGLPVREYFLWTDDLEYTSRVLRDASGYLVPESQVTHKTPTAHSPITSAEPQRFYFHVRNSLFLLRGTSLSPAERLDYFRYWLRSIREFLVRHRWSPEARRIVWRGLRDGAGGIAR